METLMIKVLENPKTENYWRLKNLVLSGNFPWYFNPYTTEGAPEKNDHVILPFYSHSFLIRPDSLPDHKLYPMVFSQHLDLATKVLSEICIYNKISIFSFMRINANCVNPTTVPLKTISHYDHRFKHKNLLLYLTDVGGDTVVEGERHSPNEDDAVVFEGKHYFEAPVIRTQVPMNERRIVIVATFLEYNRPHGDYDDWF